MPDDPQLPAHLLSIKSHIDSHGFGCAVMSDHVAIGICAKCGEDGRVIEGIKRIRSFDESRQMFGCKCGLSE